jgi:peptidoglycan/LPS O-acetylase OafA/YrhL
LEFSLPTALNRMKASSNNGVGSRIPELDGLRGLAISLVLFEHYVAGAIVPGASWLGDLVKKFNAGWTGVDLFFVLSGFLIGGILMDNRSSENYFKVFYARRCCRILPLYFLNLAVFYAALKLLSPQYGLQAWFAELFSKGGVPPLWTNLTFTQQFFFVFTGKYNADWMFVTWTLVMEEQFYLLLPFLIWMLRPIRLLPILLAMMGLNSLVQFYLLIFHPRLFDIIFVLLPLRGDALVIGVFSAFLIRQAGFKNWLAQNYRRLLAIFFVLLAGLVYFIPRYNRAMFIYERLLFYNLWIALLYACLLLLVISHRESIFAKVMRFAPLCRLGVISYGVYLLQLPVNCLLRGLILGRTRAYQGPIDIVMTIVALFITILLASLIWRFFEKPIVAWGHAFRYGKSKKQA